jgi:hypothetical protein
MIFNFHLFFLIQEKVIKGIIPFTLHSNVYITLYNEFISQFLIAILNFTIKLISREIQSSAENG